MSKQSHHQPIKADNKEANLLFGRFPLWPLLVFDRHHRHRSLFLSPAEEAYAMDFDFRVFGLHSAKHLSAVQAARLQSDNVSSVYDSDGDDDARSYFPCPFCYVEIEVPVLCSHLEEEHCFNFKNAVCPLCAANLGKDATRHFIVQHASSLKRRRKSVKSNSWSGNSSMVGKKLVTNARGNRRDPTPDPLVSRFVCSASIQNPDSVQQHELSSNNVSTISDGNRAGDEKDQQERKQKAEFVQQLTASTIFEEMWC